VTARHADARPSHSRRARHLTGSLDDTGRKEHIMPSHQDTPHKHVACGDVIDGCAFTASAATDEELIQKVVAHAAKDHGITEVTPDMAAQVKAAIKSQPAR
jgi:predicted small metal-binding protein